MTRLLLIHLLFYLAFNAPAQSTQEDFILPAPKSLDSLKKIALWSTQYYIHQFSSGGEIPIVLANGKNSGLFADTCNFCEASLEGTAYVKDSLGMITVINYAKTGDFTFVDCRKCKKYAGSKLAVESWGKTLWSISSGFGDGVLNYKLFPFRTIAVDKKTIDYGSVIFIPSVVGKTIELPNGEKVLHDGYFFAGDTGGAIKGNHIDTFTGIFEENPFPKVITSNATTTFEAYLVNDVEMIEYLKKLHQK